MADEEVARGRAGDLPPSLAILGFRVPHHPVVAKRLEVLGKRQQDRRAVRRERMPLASLEPVDRRLGR